MSKDKLVQICKALYTYLIDKGMNSALVKIIIGALFGIACAYLLTSCSVSYKNDSIEYLGSILTPITVKDLK